MYIMSGKSKLELNDFIHWSRENLWLKRISEVAAVTATYVFPLGSSGPRKGRYGKDSLWGEDGSSSALFP